MLTGSHADSPGGEPGSSRPASRAAWAKLERFLVIGLYTGLRSGEICRLAWSDVDFLAGMVRARETKSRRDRLVPLHPHLRLYLAGLDRVGRDQRVVQLRAERARDLFNALVDELGWREVELASQRVRPHTLRHTFTAHAAMAGVPLDTLRHWLGHSACGRSPSTCTSQTPTAARPSSGCRGCPARASRLQIPATSGCRFRQHRLERRFRAPGSTKPLPPRCCAARASVGRGGRI